MKIAVLGADGFVGARFSEVASSISSVETARWSFEKVDGGSDQFYHGRDQLQMALNGADVVVNLHEAQDFSAKPDEVALHLHNVSVVEWLLAIHSSSPQHRFRLIHLSTPFLQCSSRWPNVYGAEESADLFVHDRPFQAYCRSKQAAESLIAASLVDCHILRPVPVYGPGDESSVLSDLLRVTRSGIVPVIGDGDGVMQMMHIYNLTSAIWASVEQLLGDLRPSFENSLDSGIESLQCDSLENSSEIIEETSWSSRGSVEVNTRTMEVILLADDTEKKNVYTCYKDILANGGRVLSNFSIPFLPFYFIYSVIVFCLQIADNFINLSSLMTSLPHPDFLYFNFRHFTFINATKSRFLLNFRPPVSAENALKSSQLHYNSLKTISRFSWMNSRPTAS